MSVEMSIPVNEEKDEYVSDEIVIKGLSTHFDIIFK